MKHAMKLMAVSAIVLMISAPAAFAQSQEVSTLSITEPTDVGGTILQPGTYLVRVVSPQADRNKVQITSVDRDKVYATVLTIPHQLEPNEEVPNSTFVYFPAESGRPRTLRTWFSTNPVTGGHDFVYEQGRATQLARLTNEPVVYYRSEPTVAEYNVVTPEAKVEEYSWPEPVMAEPTPAPVQTTEVTTTTVTTPAPEPMPAPVMETTAPNTTPMASSASEDTTDTTSVEMPQTASRTPLFALLGLIALIGAAAIRFARS